MSFQSKIQNWRKRTPITIKMLSVTVLIGLIVWAVLDYIQTRNIRSIFLSQMNERLERQAEEDRLRFDHYIKSFQQSVRVYLQTRNFNNYINKQKWSAKDKIKIKYYRQPPLWFPERSLQRIFENPRFALLIDKNKRVREVYRNKEGAPPPSLLKPSTLLLSKSIGQNYMTDIENAPYLLTSESLLDSHGRLLAILMFASPIDDKFLIASLGVTASENITALLSSGERLQIITSTNLLKAAAGTPLERVEEEYFIVGKEFFDYGDPRLAISLVSLISMAEVEKLTMPVVWKARQRHAVSAFIFILSFAVIMFWITYRIRRLTLRISDFSEKTLGIPQEKLKKGDELYALHERFKYLTKEVVDARDEIAMAIKREAEEMTRLIVNNAFDAIITMDINGVITTWNPQAEKVFGWSSHEIIGHRAADTIIPLSYRKAHEDGLKHFLATGEGRILNKTIETTGFHRKGHEFPVELAVASALSGDDHIFIAIIRDISGRKKTEEHIRASLKEKEVLLKEIHHRVKNNMQIITSLLRLQAGKSADEREIEMLRESRNRITSMSLIHEKLYRTSDLAHINFKDYVHDLIKGLYRSYGIDTKKISCNIEAEDILLDIDTAIPCGLIVNELVSNALKYAFPGDRRGTINVRLRRILESEIKNEEPQIQNPKSKILELTLSDNGIGIPGDFDLKNSSSLGLKLVATLSENQLNGKIERTASEGTSFRIRFKEKSHVSDHEM
ncbi:MAG: histidine kinase dimerization/phosphoacceptor domain -containing protein [Nitrospirota bacterium]